MKKINQSPIYDPIHYAYKGRYIKGRLLGNILAVLIVTASLIVGCFTKEVIFDTIICAVTFGNFLRNIGIMVLLLKIGDRDYYVYDQDISCDDTTKEKRVGIYDEMIKRAHWITLSFGFFELYFPFLLTIIIPNTLGKIIIPLIFIAGVTINKIICNPVKSRKDIYILGNCIFEETYYKIRIVIRAILTSAPFYVAGLLLNSQKWFPVNVFDDTRVVVPILVLGIFYNISGDYRVFKSYIWCRGSVTFEFTNQMVANYFGIKTWNEVYEQREREMKEPENERLKTEGLGRFENVIRHYYLYFHKDGEIYARRREEQERKEREREEQERKEREREEQERKEQERKREEEERLKKAQRKLDQGKISEISQEDLNKLMKMEAERFKVKIRESSKLSRATVNRKID